MEPVLSLSPRDKGGRGMKYNSQFAASVTRPRVGPGWWWQETADTHKSQGHPDLELSPAFKGPGSDSSSLGLGSHGDEGSWYF